MTNNIILIMGAPGSGKTTLINAIKEDFDFFDLSLGEVFRNILNGNDNILKEKLCEQLRGNNSFETDFVMGIIENNVLQNLEKNLLIEGIKNFNEVGELHKVFQKYNLAIKLSILLYCDENISKERINQRGSRDCHELPNHFKYRMKKFFSEKDQIINLLKNISDDTIIIDSTRLTTQEVYTIFKEQVFF